MSEPDKDPIVIDDNDLRTDEIAKSLTPCSDLSSFDFENDFRPVINRLYLQCSMGVLDSTWNASQQLLTIIHLTNARIDWLIAKGHKIGDKLE